MSSLDQDEADKQLQRAVPWVSDPQHREQRDSETRRLQEDVLEAARRLERESAKFQLPAEVGTAAGFRLAQARTREEEHASRVDRVDPEEKARKIWAELKPEFISAPPRDGWGLRGLMLAVSFLGAMAVSAIIATIIVNVVHPPAKQRADLALQTADVKSEERVAKGDSLAATTLGDLARVSEAQAKMTHADEPAAASTETALASALPDDIAATKSATAAAPIIAKVEPTQPDTTPAANPAPAASPAPEPQRAPSMPQDEIASLLKRGQDLIAAGDIASARLLLTLVAEAGNAEASFTLAGTFDPAVLAKLPAIGVRADPEKARTWYARAAEQGSLEARQHLQALR